MAEVGSRSGTDGASAGSEPAPRVDIVMGQVLGMIRDRDLKPGQPLPSEMAMAELFAVSRPVVREALRSLAVLSIIDIGNGRAARVAIPSGDVLGLVVEHAVRVAHVSIQQIYDVRRTVEVRTVALAAVRRTQEEADRLQALVAAMYRDRENAPQAMEHDIAFHQVIAVAARNPMFDLIVRSFESITRQTWGPGWATRTTAADRDLMISFHQRIADAIADQNPAAASAAMIEHFDNSIRALLDAGIH